MSFWNRRSASGRALKERIVEWFGQKEEISPTALETLAQCRYIFLLERVFGLREPRLADDTPDPMDRGGLIHSILHEIYASIALGTAGTDVPRRWAVKTAKGWMVRSEEGVDALPLGVFVPGKEHDYLDFARRKAEARMDEATLGHPGIWSAEREKILQMVLGFVSYDIETCAAGNRYPALFELRFGGDTAVDAGAVRLHGIIDRIDLVFEKTGLLKQVRVLDYKGASRARSRAEDYRDEIIRNLDCQLPVYAFAAQQFFFGEFNTPRVNALTETGYLFYERDASKIGSALEKCLVQMDEPGVVDGFLATLFENIKRLKEGDFAVDPLIAGYTDHMSICRTEAVERDELE